MYINKMDPTDPMQPQEDNYKFKVLKELSSKDDIDAFNKKAKSGNGNTFIIYFADWCGHCKALAPELIKLDQFLSENKDKVHGNIVRIEESNKNKLDVFNDVPGFPTILILDGKGEKSKEFNEKTRDMNGFLTFLSNNGVIDESLKPKEESQSGGKKSNKSKKNKKSKKTTRKNTRKNTRKTKKTTRKH